MVHYMQGQVCDLDTWLRAGVLVTEYVIITGGRRPPHDEEHMVDAAHIMAAQKISKSVLYNWVIQAFEILIAAGSSMLVCFSCTARPCHGCIASVFRLWVFKGVKFVVFSKSMTVCPQSQHASRLGKITSRTAKNTEDY